MVKEPQIRRRLQIRRGVSADLPRSICRFAEKNRLIRGEELANSQGRIGRFAGKNRPNCLHGRIGQFTGRNGRFICICTMLRTYFVGRSMYVHMV